jgi:hypothetical protein
VDRRQVTGRQPEVKLLIAITVPRNAFRRVARAEPAIQRLVQSAADAALAREEGMADTGTVIENSKCDHHRSVAE